MQMEGRGVWLSKGNKSNTSGDSSRGSMHETECLGMVHWDDPEGWDREGYGRGVQDGEHMYTHCRFMSMYGKTHYNTVK